jgi:hypothetical protein
LQQGKAFNFLNKQIVITFLKDLIPAEPKQYFRVADFTDVNKIYRIIF